jgi:collagenase-like PrtC family protease
MYTKFTVPTPFTSDFIDSAAALNAEFEDSGAQIYELYGSFQSGAFHSARPSKYLPAVTREQFSRHVAAARKHCISFNYLLNAPSYANLEYTHDGRRQLEELLSFLVNTGVDSVTVAIPYLAQIINRRFPQLEVVISTIGYVGAVAGLQQFSEAGAGRIVVDVEVNRDFQFLEKSIAAQRTELEVIVNPVCISQCHFKYNHYCVASTGAQSFLHGGAGMPYNQYYLNWCFLKKLQNRAEFLKSPWIRPEDLHLWQERGIKFYKIVGRGLTGPQILRLCRSYLSRKFSGNLLELLGWPHWLAFRDNPDGSRLPPLEVILENSALEGFLSFFVEKKPQCRLGCDNCRYCDGWALRTLSVNDEALLEKYQQNMERNLHRLIDTIPSKDDTERALRDWQQQASNQEIDE